MKVCNLHSVQIQTVIDPTLAAEQISSWPT